jgi:hypothetical protein
MAADGTPAAGRRGLPPERAALERGRSRRHFRRALGAPRPPAPARGTRRTDPAGEAAIARTVLIKLNGGLGTSMGLERAKSLIVAKNGLSFLDIIVRQVEFLRRRCRAPLPLLLMNSFSTEADSLAALAEAHPNFANGGLPLSFCQHRVPKLELATRAPVRWPENPALEWCPPGHADIYHALQTTGLLDALLAAGFRYAFVSNADNLGALLHMGILGHVATQRIPFLMEVTARTECDRKGGHLAATAKPDASSCANPPNAPPTKPPISRTSEILPVQHQQPLARSRSPARHAPACHGLPRSPSSSTARPSTPRAPIPPPSSSSKPPWAPPSPASTAPPPSSSPASASPPSRPPTTCSPSAPTSTPSARSTRSPSIPRRFPAPRHRPRPALSTRTSPTSSCASPTAPPASSSAIRSRSTATSISARERAHRRRRPSAQSHRHPRPHRRRLPHPHPRFRQAFAFALFPFFIGFIGTVQGLGATLVGFGDFLASGNADQMKNAVIEIFKGIGISLDTLYLGLWGTIICLGFYIQILAGRLKHACVPSAQPLDDGRIAKD